MSKRRFKPVSKLPYQAEITSLSHEGRGIANVNGKVKFLRGGLPSETVMAHDLKTHRSYDEGQVVEVIKPAADRVTPPCAHVDICGGCSLQHLAPDAQIHFKQQVLLEQLNHIGQVTPETILPPLRSPTLGYRHKARLGVKYVAAKGKILVGFREINGRYLADIQSCVVLHPSIGQKLTLLSELIGSLVAYNTIPQIEIAVGDDAAALIFRHLQPLGDEDKIKLCDFGQQQQLQIYLQPGGLETIHKIWPEDQQEWLTYTLPFPTAGRGIDFRFHPSNFTQINPFINQQMVERALELLNPQPNERFLDLFCGLGNFTLPLAQHCLEIIGVEGEAGLVQRALDNATLNQINNAKFYAANLAEDFSQAPFLQTKFDKILLDPPRTGALEAVKIIAKLQPRLILYVSCNPATLARDAKELLACGYHLAQAGVMDMFPHTSHVESIALFVPLYP